MEVHQLHQGIAGGQVCPLFLGGVLLFLLIGGFGGSQGVVAIADGKEQNGLALGIVLSGKVMGASQGVQNLTHVRL